MSTAPTDTELGESACDCGSFTFYLPIAVAKNKDEVLLVWDTYISQILSSLRSPVIYKLLFTFDLFSFWLWVCLQQMRCFFVLFFVSGCRTNLCVWSLPVQNVFEHFSPRAWSLLGPCCAPYSQPLCCRFLSIIIYTTLFID